MLKLANIFSEGMVLQRDVPVKIWGEADCPVTVSVDMTSAVDYARDGKFTLTLPPHGAGGPYTMFIEAGGEVRKINDVYFGDVFLAGGQSNMALDLECTGQTLDECSGVIRMYTVSGDSEIGRSFDGRDVWLSVTEENAAYVSALASHFATEIANTQNVPVGIISCNSGGSSVRSWISPETVASDPVFGPETIWHFEVYRYDFNSTSYLYKQKLLTVAPYTVKAVLWYQGESDVADNSAYKYAHLFELLMADWRCLFENDDLQFIIAQITYGPPRRNHEIWHIVREQQLLLHNTVDGVHMITTGDVGDHKDLHPRDKKTVGHRFALAARGILYGEDVICRPPVCREMTVDGDVAVLKFSDAGDGLYEDAPLTFKGISAKGHEFIGEYKIEGDTIRVWCEGHIPAVIYFCFENDVEVHLYSSAGLPASPFRIGAPYSLGVGD